MKIQKKLNKDILAKTLEIKEKFPELTKYLNEIPIIISNNDSTEIKNKNLTEYYETLNNLLKNYSKEH